MSDVRILADTPGFLLAADLRAVVRAAIDDLRDRFAGPLGDLRAGGLTAGVLDRIVEEGGDCFLLGPAELQHGRANGEYVRDVGDVGTLSGLAGMELDREVERVPIGRGELNRHCGVSF